MQFLTHQKQLLNAIANFATLKLTIKYESAILDRSIYLSPYFNFEHCLKVMLLTHRCQILSAKPIEQI